MGFTIEPCAGWNLEMSDLRNTRIAEYQGEDRWAGPRAEWARRLAALPSTYGPAIPPGDDPAYIHSDAYDQRQKSELALRDEYQNDMVGPGGWRNINVEHYRNVDITIRKHRGKRILVTFGAGHKYWLLEQLRQRDDIEVLEMESFLPG
jgi:hypothetical protein